MDDYGEMVGYLMEHYYWGVTRYSTSGFLRVKLGDALTSRGVAPHIYESADEARKHLHEIEQRSSSS
jgi:propionate CoA-transferase